MHWSSPLDASKFASPCPQANRGVFASPSVNEDCLYLNVFAPNDPAGTAGRAVMVWIHGGGLFSGESNDYDATKLVSAGDVVVVTINYRIGALGFFSHPAINGEGHAFANYGIMDQQFALKWVQRNIRQFGGDPANVTIFGQSGGGTAVMANIESPTAANLFHRAINESGTHIEFYDPAVALRDAQMLAANAGCHDQTPQCMRSLSVQQILENQPLLLKHFVNAFPLADGIIIKERAASAFGSGRFNKIPILNGLVADEQAFFLPEVNGGKPADVEDLNTYIRSFGEGDTVQIKSLFASGSAGSPSLAEIAIAQEAKACAARQLDEMWSKHVPVYAYEFDDRTAPSYFKTLSYPMRAYHTAELQYLFPSFHGGRGVPHALNAAQGALSDRMVSYFTNFAKSGDPNRPMKPDVIWPAYDETDDDLLSLDIPADKVVSGYGSGHHCSVWDPINAKRY